MTGPRRSLGRTLPASQLTMTRSGYRNGAGAVYELTTYGRGVTLSIARRKAPRCPWCGTPLPSHATLLKQAGGRP